MNKINEIALSIIAMLMSFLLVACQQDATETESLSSSESLKAERRQNEGSAPIGSEDFSDASNGKSVSERSDLSDAFRKIPRPEAIDFSDEEILVEARINIASNDRELRLQAVADLDLNDANDLALLENVLLSDPSSEVREEVVMHLADGAPDKTAPLLMKALNDSNSDVVISALDWLSTMDVSDKPSLIAAFKQIAATHPDQEVREAAEGALDMMD
ncbi:HEAT repeat domain-containing protein [Methylotuvimicrobium buryatense]|uniref:HEAT repeat domain-containing protein n=1 Tax=Methylotuvimicrobium buryatense TaxID=95641 RepID=A0A4P9UKI7_METBY|nr:HEAT repeat domain-containing protein [Methylotuvimicrobium buryatense]QCW81714.1 HEAT repeat domain-containing protein [Methylotuvimicrobium buryatense]